MPLTTIFNEASIIMTVVSLVTFLGILFWVYSVKGAHDFDEIACLPLEDEPAEERAVEKYDE